MSDLYERLADEEVAQRAAVAGASVRSVAGVNPDQQARALQASRETGMPLPVVERNLDAVEQQRQQRELDALISRSPILARQLANPAFAGVAHDDLSSLGGIEQSVTAIGRASRALLAGFGPGLGASAYGAAAYPFEAIGATGVGGKLRDLQRESQGVAQRFIGDNSDAGIVERGIVSGMQSAGQTLATLPLGFANAARVSGEALMLGAMGALTFGQSYGKARDKGVGVGMSGFLGAADATAEIVTEKFFGAAGLVKDAKAGMGAARLFIRDIAREIPGEVGATLWQNFNEWAIINPDKTVGEFIEDQPAAIGETIIATIAGGGAQVGAIRGAQRLMGDVDRRQAQADAAEAGAQQAEALAQFAAASKVMGRDAETVRGFVAQVADEDGDVPTEFFVDADQLVNVLNQSGMTAQEFEALAPVAAAQMGEPGGLVRLPMSEFVGMGEAAASLIDHIRTAEDMPSRAEAREFVASDQGAALKVEVERQLSALTERDAYQQDVEKAAAGFRADLDAAARFTPEANKFLAALPANYYAATARRLGITVDEFLDRYQLRSTSKAVKAKPGDAEMWQGRRFSSLRGMRPTASYVDATPRQQYTMDAIDEGPEITDFDLLPAKEDINQAADASFTDWEKDPGIKYVPLEMIGPLGGYDNAKDTARIRRLADAIKESNTLEPIFVGIDPNGEAYIMEGQHRARALQLLGETHIPAQVIVSMEGEDADYAAMPDEVVASPTDYMDAGAQRALFQGARAQRDMIELRKREAVLKRLLECL